MTAPQRQDLDEYDEDDGWGWCPCCGAEEAWRLRGEYCTMCTELQCGPKRIRCWDVADMQIAVKR